MKTNSPRYIEMPSGLIVPEHVAEAYARGFIRPKAIDFFAGCGGMSLGIIQGGFEVLAAVENDPVAALTYMVNLGAHPCQFHPVDDKDLAGLEKALNREIEGSRRKGLVTHPVSGSGWIKSQPPSTPGVKHFFLGDVRKLTGRDILKPLGIEPGELDLICGGPPCQGFSRAGKQNVMDPRNSLVFDFARLICEIRPKSIVMENVPGIINMITPEGLPVIDQFCRILEDGQWGGLNGLLKCLEAQTGRVGLLRNKRASKKADDEDFPMLPAETKQMSLLEFGL